MDDRTGQGQEAAARAKEVEDARALLLSVRSTVADLLAAVAAGEAGALGALVQKQGELESALKRLFETEGKYNDWIGKQTGRGRDGDIDLAAVRHQIGCRLARLRACCREG
ncbi:hypothetical protein [Pseudoroseicyclus aestuarii]|uniref:Uncharacterized protein n=1 Tax=Pseudoroseicyclus aestuarii TaxID=1795041 RepID=A0A318SV97_9RHOB|nr:hypothetical protein [Pseudoroseicyclus aestuarii]PYE85770.1 hypothetical protein DFP88_101442 [Pseudoroseicyclus aestuarii]